MPRKIPETITEQEFIKMAKTVKKPKLKLAFMLGFYQGMRLSEVIALKRENIDYNLILANPIPKFG